MRPGRCAPFVIAHGTRHIGSTHFEQHSVVLCSQQIQFGLMDPSEIVKTSEFQVYERSLYKVRPAHKLLQSC